LYKAIHASATPAQVKSALITAATTDWNDVDDPDHTKEPLLNISSFQAVEIEVCVRCDALQCVALS